MSNFVFREDDAAFKKLTKALEGFPKTCNFLRLAASLGAVVAGGAAISLFEGNKEGRYRPARDLDLWFPSNQVLDVFIATVKLSDNMNVKKSFGGHAYDIVSIGEYGPTIQVIAFRVGDPIEIISEFDFTNCAIALNATGFWYHKDVPGLLESKRLVIQKDNSSFFSSRVYKYLRKGFHTLDESVQDRLFQELDAMADKGIEAAKKFDQNALNKPLHEHDASYKPLLSAVNKAASILDQFLSFTKHMPKSRNGKNETIEVFKPSQKEILIEKLNEMIALKKNASDMRTRTYNLPYGYTKGASEDGDPDIDAILNLV